MKRILLTLVLSLGLSSAAHAQTFAQVVITHINQFVVTPAGPVVLHDLDTDLVFRLDEDGDRVFQLPFTEFDNLQVGQPIVTTYDYSMTVSTRGLPYDGPLNSYCTPLFATQCFETFGFERAFAQLIVGYVDPRGANPFHNYGGDQVTLLSDGGLLSASGQLTASIATTSDMEPAGRYSSLVFLAVMAAPIPEPATWALMLAGVMLVAGMRYRRRAAPRCALPILRADHG
jgi:hypothetical protein